MRGQPQTSPIRSLTPRGPRRAGRIPPEPGGDGRPQVARPLPDPVAIRLCRVPQTAPPYDDEAPGTAGPGRADILAATIMAALGRDGRPGRERSRPAGGKPTRRDTRRTTGTEPRDGTAQTTGASDAGQERPGTSPAPGTWPSRFAQVLAETLAGSRPPAQIAPWTTERALSRIRRLGSPAHGRPAAAGPAGHHLRALGGRRGDVRGGGLRAAGARARRQARANRTAGPAREPCRQRAAVGVHRRRGGLA